jgi:DNA-binding Xre family transcriptional regulator
MKFYLSEEKLKTILEGKENIVRLLAKELDITTQEMYNKLKGKNGIDIKKLNSLCNYLQVGAENVLKEESLQDLEDYRNDLEYLDTLNAQY